MKRKLFSISLALALLLTTLAPAAALAAKPPPKVEDFNAIGGITYISDGTVKPAGNSGRWVVATRDLGGALSGDINEEYTLTYKANVELATQAGNLHGTLQTESYSLEVNGKIEPLDFVYFAPWGIYLPMLTIDGQWTFINGTQGNGDFTAYAVFVPDEYGHVLLIVDSGFDMTGKWQP